MFSKNIRIQAILLLLFGMSLSAQSFQGAGSSGGSLLSDESATSSLSSESSSTVLPVGNIVDPSTYYLGPGDVISIRNLYASPVADRQIKISPENILSIPRIGDICVTGKTLTEVRTRIIELVKGTSSDAPVFVNLVMPRNVVITVSGNPNYQGIYTYPASFNVETILKLIEQSSTKTESYAGAKPFNPVKIHAETNGNLSTSSGMTVSIPYYSRNISIKHSDGSYTKVDLIKSRLMNVPKMNPSVREGDEIKLPDESLTYPLISVSGAVVTPSSLPFKQGDNLEFLLKVGGGFTENFDPANSYLLSSDGTKTPVEFDESGNLRGSAVELRAGDNLIIGMKPTVGSSKQGIVSVNGCVHKQGAYPVIFGQTRLKDVIKAAGGFTDEASLDLAYVRRIPAGRSLDEKHVLMSYGQDFQYSDLHRSDSLSFQTDQLYSKYMVSCDFTKAFTGNSEADNVLLEPGDIIVVPKTPAGIFVYGQVIKPGIVSFVPGKTMQWYVEQAGGFAENAKKKHTRIIRGRTRVWVDGGSEDYVLAGDEVYVPRPTEVPPESDAQSWSMIISMVMSAATLLNMYLYWRKN